DLRGAFDSPTRRLPRAIFLFSVMESLPSSWRRNCGHLSTRRLNFWTMGFIISPFLSPFAFGFLVARQSWKWAYGIGCIYSAVPHTTGFRYKFEILVGITGIKMARYRVSWTESILSPVNIVWRPHLLGILLFEGILFGFGIGINVTNAVYLGSPAPVGFGWSQDAIAGAYGTPIVSVLLGELIGRYTNDWIMNMSIRRNHGVFEAESRLWACYIALPLYICGPSEYLNTAGIIMGWGISELAIMINTVAIYAYCNDCFPKHQGEISALINLARVLGGFAVAYFQVPWAEKHGALQTFGCEAAIVAGLFVLIIPAMQIYGRSLRPFRASEVPSLVVVNKTESGTRMRVSAPVVVRTPGMRTYAGSPIRQNGPPSAISMLHPGTHPSFPTTIGVTISS
ncbi:hypothetical protein EDD85DRAFT_832538, partial [Armillaria nabsnona]